MTDAAQNRLHQENHLAEVAEVAVCLVPRDHSVWGVPVLEGVAVCQEFQVLQELLVLWDHPVRRVPAGMTVPEDLSARLVQKETRVSQGLKEVSALQASVAGNSACLKI